MNKPKYSIGTYVYLSRNLCSVLGISRDEVFKIVDVDIVLNYYKYTLDRPILQTSEGLLVYTSMEESIYMNKKLNRRFKIKQILNR